MNNYYCKKICKSSIIHYFLLIVVNTEEIIGFAHFRTLLQYKGNSNFCTNAWCLKWGVAMKGWLNLTPRLSHKFQLFHSHSCICILCHFWLLYDQSSVQMWSWGYGWSAHSFLSGEHFLLPHQLKYIFGMRYINLHILLSETRIFLKTPRRSICKRRQG